jgi:hypothetical protein
MAFFYGNFRKIDLLHHPLPLSAGEILPFPFIATPKIKVFHRLPLITSALPRYFSNLDIVLFLQYFNQRSRNKSIPPSVVYFIGTSAVLQQPRYLLFLQNCNQRSSYQGHSRVLYVSSAIFEKESRVLKPKNIVF